MPTPADTPASEAGPEATPEAAPALGAGAPEPGAPEPGAPAGPASGSDPDDILATALAWHRAGLGAALATVVETWGSAPRRVGSQLAVSGAGAFVGSVSGGCVEGAVVEEALAALASGSPRILRYGVSDESAFAAGLACGGTIRVMVEPVGPGAAALSEELLGALVAARAARAPVALVTDTVRWTRQLLGPDTALETGQNPAPVTDQPAVPAPLPPQVADLVAGARSGFDADGRRFVAQHSPPLRLVIVGAVHIAQALVPMARQLGFDPILTDPRSAFAAAHRFPGEILHEAYADEIFPEIGLDAHTAVVTLSHEPRIDDPGLLAALGSDAFYIGALGSRRTHAKRLARLGAAGVAPAGLARIHAPVGLDIGAEGPAEIALSILAEITACRRKGIGRAEAGPGPVAAP